MVYPQTWNEAAHQMLLSFDHLPRKQQLTPAEMNEVLDELVAALNKGDWCEMSDRYLIRIAIQAVNYLKENDQWSVSEMTDLLCRKQHDYGHKNINRFGLNGIVVRLSDKLARLENLNNKPNPRNEAVLDTWYDIVGYCVIAEMLMDGTFQYDLEDPND